MRFIAMLALCLLIFVQPSHAAPPDCDATKEGTIVYNKDRKLVQFCNGTQWIGMVAKIGGEGDTLSDLNCLDGEVPEWNGAAWACGAGGGESLWTDSGQGYLTYDGDKGVKLANVTGMPPPQFQIGDLGCANDEILKWDGTLWACAADASGSGGDNLGNHTATANINLGTTRFISPDGTNVGLSIGLAGGIATQGGNAGFYATPRDGSGDQWAFYNPTGDDMRLWRTTGGDALTVLKNGNVGIGTTAPVNLLHIKGGEAGIFLEETEGGADNEAYLVHFQNRFQIQNRMSTSGSAVVPYSFDIRAPANTMVTTSSGNVGIGTTTSPAYKLDVRGGVVAGAGAYVNTSDVRLKKDVEAIGYGLDAVMALRPVGFNWKDQTEKWAKAHQLGFIAQDVEQLIPEVVTVADDEMKTRSIAYGSLVPVLTKAIQELKAANDSQAAQLERLRNEIDTLKKADP